MLGISRNVLFEYRITLYRVMLGDVNFSLGLFGALVYLDSRKQRIIQSTFYPQGVKIELMSAVQAAVSEIWTDFQNCCIWA